MSHMKSDLTEEDDSVDCDLMNSMASDALSIPRMDLFALGLYASILALIFREGSHEFVGNIGNSLYTNLGIQFLIGSMVATVWFYIHIRKIAARSSYKNKGVINDEELVTYSLASVALGSVIAVFLLLVGIIDGFSQDSLLITQLPVLFLPVALIIFLFDLLVLPRIAKKYYKSWKQPAVSELEEKD